MIAPPIPIHPNHPLRLACNCDSMSYVHSGTSSYGLIDTDYTLDRPNYETPPVVKAVRMPKGDSLWMLGLEWKREWVVGERRVVLLRVP
jgi:hypothetical protein